MFLFVIHTFIDLPAVPIALLTEDGCVDDRIMAERHISVPVMLTSGDVREWFLRFKICSKANTWSKETMSLILPTLSEYQSFWHEWNSHKMFKKIMALRNSTSLLG